MAALTRTVAELDDAIDMLIRELRAGNITSVDEVADRLEQIRGTVESLGRLVERVVREPLRD